ncbi:sporulation protein rmd1 [Lithohypha guttulata]|uniref:sporulation protein rmd1 n=1 Tax=Lithohypha guttulata TaxID=1690604 RepID=UPI002DDFD3E3|nr:sporulation protein rmd1 [Lithohypha guttulata]KAK5103053.1 sporulation protein rmd1 [Lithohypha guttulata]
MATQTTEASPLLGRREASGSISGSTSRSAQRSQRTVTFNPHTQISSQPGSSSLGAPLRPAHSPSQTLTSDLTSKREPLIQAFNSKLRRRNSHGGALPVTQPFGPGPRIGAQRTTRTAEKLKILPNPDFGDEGPDEESGRDVYSQFTRIKDPSARRDAARLGKADRERLPRVTTYCTAQGYKLESILKFMKSRTKTRGASPRLFDECLYSPYDYDYLKKRKVNENMFNRNTGMTGERSTSRSPVEERIERMRRSPRIRPNERRFSDSAVEVEEHQQERRENLIDLQNELGTSSMPGQDDSDPTVFSPTSEEPRPNTLVNTISKSSEDLNDHREQDDLHSAFSSSHPDIDTNVESPEVFVFDYGTIVIWGMNIQQEQRFLSDLAKFATSPLPSDSVQTEEFNFYYTKEYQARIYNDFISLRDPRNHLIKLAISHALSQSVKTSLFEDLVSETIETTSPLPAVIAQTGSVNLTRRQLNMQIGELFILRINIHLQGSVLDSPELFWAEPHLEPVYAAVRSYLEIGQRVTLLTERLDVISDLLAVLREQGSRRHDEILEWIVIVLIAAEIVVAAINIVVDLVAGVD